MQLLHLSIPENEGIFMDYCEQNDIYLSFVEMDGRPLKSLIANYRTLVNFRHILLHYETTPVLEEVLAGVSYIKKFFHARIIVFAPACTAVDILYGELLKLNIRDLVKVDQQTDFIKELKACLSPEGKGFAETSTMGAEARRQTARSLARPSLVLPDGVALKISIAGTQQRVGTTTQAFGIYHAAKAWGLTPCIVDRSQEVIKNLMLLYKEEVQQLENVVEIRGVAFSHEILVGTKYNTFLIDHGCVKREAVRELQACDIRILCSGSKAWELPYLLEVLCTYPDAVEQILLSFASAREQEELVPTIVDLPPAAFAPWNPDIWGTENNSWYDNILLPKVKEAVQKKGTAA